jgi:hypothetical protein
MEELLSSTVEKDLTKPSEKLPKAPTFGEKYRKHRFLIVILLVVLISGGVYFVANNGLIPPQKAPAVNMTKGQGFMILSGQGVTFQQVDHMSHRPPERDSDEGRVEANTNALFRATGLSSGYINVFTDAGWVVENLFVDVNDQYPGVMYFSLGLAQPTDVKQLSAFVVYSSGPQTSFTDGQRSTFPVGTDVQNIGGAGVVDDTGTTPMPPGNK